MACTCSPTPLVLAHRTRLESERNGGAVLYWADELDPDAFNGATSVLVYRDLLALYSGSLGGNIVVSLVAQQSVDGVDWDIDSISPLTTWTTVGKGSQRIAVPNRAEFGPWIRDGLQIANSAASTVASNEQVAAQISCVLVPLGDDNEVAESSVTGIDADAATGDIVGTELSTLGLANVVIGIRATGFGAAETWTCQIRGSFNGTDFYNLPCEVNGVAAPTGAVRLAQPAPLSPIVRCQTLPPHLVVTKTGGTAAKGTVVIELVGRGF